MQTTDTLNDIIDRIVRAIHPLKIILFGSAARGEAGPDSDVDVLVIVPNGTDRRAAAKYLHTQFFGVPAAVDVIVATPNGLERHADNPGLIYRTILREGVELYAA